MATELKSIIKNQTWVFVDRPKDAEIIGSRMVLRNKYKPDGTIEKRKARLVARGFAQRPGIHFSQTFAPVARLSSIRLIVALAVQQKMKIHQLDITTAYLNGVLQEEIYMEPPNFIIEALEVLIEKENRNSEMRERAKAALKELEAGDKVCLLKKSLYGLRQAGRNWHATLDKSLRKLGAAPTNADPCVYQLRKEEDIILIAIYVDDIIIASRSVSGIEKLKASLAQEFDVKDLGEINYCLGIEFSRSGNGIALYQSGYVRDVLDRFGMTESNAVKTPMDSNVKLVKPDKDVASKTTEMPYRELIGALMYLAVSTRPDIAFAVSSLSQFNDCCNETHWTAAKRVLRYLKGTMSMGILFKPTTDPLKCFVDSDWASCLNDRRSYTGFTTILSSGPVSWEAKKQRTVALSSTEAEYMGLAEAAEECIYFRGFLTELGFRDLANVVILNDNLGAQKLAENPSFHARSKHIDVTHHFILEALKDKKFIVKHVSTEDMTADIFTKGLPRLKHEKCIELLGMCSRIDLNRPCLEGEC